MHLSSARPRAEDHYAPLHPPTRADAAARPHNTAHLQDLNGRDRPPLHRAADSSLSNEDAVMPSIEVDPTLHHTAAGERVNGFAPDPSDRYGDVSQHESRYIHPEPTALRPPNTCSLRLDEVDEPLLAPKRKSWPAAPHMVIDDREAPRKRQRVQYVPITEPEPPQRRYVEEVEHSRVYAQPASEWRTQARNDRDVVDLTFSPHRSRYQNHGRISDAYEHPPLSTQWATGRGDERDMRPYADLDGYRVPSRDAVRLLPLPHERSTFSSHAPSYSNVQDPSVAPLYHSHHPHSVVETVSSRSNAVRRVGHEADFSVFPHSSRQLYQPHEQESDPPPTNPLMSRELVESEHNVRSQQRRSADDHKPSLPQKKHQRKEHGKAVPARSYAEAQRRQPKPWQHPDAAKSDRYVLLCEGRHSADSSLDATGSRISWTFTDVVRLVECRITPAGYVSDIWQQPYSMRS